MWLASGGQERDMVGRYAASAADERARAQHRARGLGDRI